MLKSSVQSKILKTLPDDRPITAIQVVEDLSKCPKGFEPISRTYDQDSVADLRDSSIFKSSAARYLCFSKTEGIPNFVLQEILVLNDKTNPPKGFSLLSRTVDTAQKAWKKKQLCYRLVNHRDLKTAITDIIVCSRLKKAPTGFSLAGELNGITLCYKMGNVQDSQSNGGSPASPPGRPPKPAAASPAANPVYPSLSDSDHDYEILMPGYSPGAPVRPAPKPPAPAPPHQYSTQTMASGAHPGLEGVPFVVNPRFLNSGSAGDRPQFPKIKAKSLQQILKEYDYSFVLERQT